ncbi:MAG: CvpA family protein [Rhizobiales bacterium]|nr:CvpA family protein [Hyphomicrobiales bacterium]
MPVTVLDIIVVAVVLISAVLAMVRGFVREVLSVASWVVAAGAAYLLYPHVLPLVQPYFDSKTLATIVSAAAIFFVALIIASYITMKISDFVIDSRIGAVDRVLGFAFGALRGVLLMIVALWFFNFLVNAPPPWVANARTMPLLVSGGDWLIGMLPPDFESWVQEKIKGGSGGGSQAPQGETPVGEPPGEAPAPEDDQAYPQDQQQGMDQLIENSGGAQ